MGSRQESPPPANYGQSVSEGPWSTGLYDCSSDFSNCCMTFWCPCVTFKQIAEIVDQGSTFHGGAIGTFYTLVSVITGCGCLYSWVYRKRMRKLYMLSEYPCNDFLVHCLCEPCALCQEYRELKSRGFDMSLGWQGNVERNQGVTIAPLSQAGMNR